MDKSKGVGLAALTYAPMPHGYSLIVLAYYVAFRAFVYLVDVEKPASNRSVTQYIGLGVEKGRR